jgi:hypothetical protein
MLSHILEGEFRPGHFEGVARSSPSCFNIVEPDARCSARRTSSSSPSSAAWWRICACRCRSSVRPTVRDADGLAMSSRNQYLSAAERAVAPRIYRRCRRARNACWRALRNDRRGRGTRGLTAAGFRPDYFAVRDAHDLHPAQAHTRELVVLARRAPRQGAPHRQSARHALNCKRGAAAAPNRYVRAAAATASARRCAVLARACTEGGVTQRHGDVARPALVADAMDCRPRMRVANCAAVQAKRASVAAGRGHGAP